MKKKIGFIISGILLICLCLVNCFVINPKQLSVREVSIESSKIDPSFDNFIIAFFSDTYFDKTDLTKLDMIVDHINKYSPDVIIFGGDLATDGQPIKRSEITEKLSSLDCPYGKYAVLGENDNNSYASILKSAGFTLLRNKSVQLHSNSKELINIVGIENVISGNQNVSSAYEKVNSNHFTFVTCHTPDIADSLPQDKTDYFVAGHSLGGEIYFPIINNLLREKGAENYYHGTYQLGNFAVDVSNGVGQKNKSARLLADAEIVIFKLKVSD